MNRLGFTLLLFVLAACVVAIGCAHTTSSDRSEPRQWSTAAWTESSPEAQGMSSRDLADALEFARMNDINIHSLTVVRNGVMVLDAYFYPYTPEMRHDVASVSVFTTDICPDSGC
jgi:hypothetical protein